MDTLRLMKAAFLAAGLAEHATIDRSDMSLKMRRGDMEWSSYPDNLHLHLQAAESDDERKALLDEFVNAMAEALEQANRPPDIRRIYPVIRHRDYIKIKKGQTGPVSVPFAGNMRIFLVEDLPASTPFVIEDDVKSLKTSTPALVSRAKKNFARLTRDARDERIANGLAIRVLDGNYESSLLLDTKFWNRKLRKHGGVIAAIPARDLLIYYAGTDPQMPATLKRIVNDLIGGLDHAISTDILRWNGKSWTAIR
ncbi:DUF1444 family protein [Alisedimentitalea sp. MJ-SS2]|uniref:DUF1444 family protein n=1 Tax=Aliisedimentitalea sp. MJ-SS2 TaxID=3049795 RepID=UPI0029156436|nr:DUF1444 family protein [Alisedimentitalea sp. MJ-SS2]MDU8926124.1 DUF1444 family protein [Alisedimentitalea sp. MJ-SS2]